MKVEEILEEKYNESISGLVLMLTNKNKRSFNNKPGNYMTMELADDSGKIQAVKWEDAEEIFDSFLIGDIVRLDGTISEYKGTKQIIVDKITTEKGDYDKSDFIPSINQKELDNIIERFETMIAELREKCSDKQGGYLEVLDNFLNSDYYENLKKWPAAIKFHHDKLGGLIQHTFHVARHVYFTCLRESGLDIALATLGAIFHDIGKIEEYSFETGAVKMTRRGVLFGHKVLGMDIVKEFCQGTSISEEEKNLLLHIIASHHGKQEYGAITEPRIPEAVLVHHADLMDAECYKVIDAVKNIEPGEFDYSDKYKGVVYNPLQEEN